MINLIWILCSIFNIYVLLRFVHKEVGFYEVSKFALFQFIFMAIFLGPVWTFGILFYQLIIKGVGRE